MLETSDLILKKASMDDWRHMYHNLWSHDKSAKYMIWRPIHSEDEAVQRMKKNLKFMESNDLMWFIYEKNSGQAIGFAGMERFEEDTYKDTGIAIGPAFTGKGYGKQVLKAMVDKSFYDLDARKFVASCRRKNEASKGMILSCGFEYAYSEDKNDPKTGQPYVLDYYELIKAK